jgi:hypothetical protein
LSPRPGWARSKCLAYRFSDYLDVDWLPEMLRLIERGAVEISLNSDHVYTDIRRVYGQCNQRDWQTQTPDNFVIEDLVSMVCRSHDSPGSTNGFGYGFQADTDISSTQPFNTDVTDTLLTENEGSTAAIM